MSLTSNNQKKFRRYNNTRAIVTICIPKPNYKIWVQFKDGLSGEIDLSHFVGKGVFKAWNDITFFNSVKIDSVTSTLSWGENIEIDPYVVRQSIMDYH